MTSQPTDETSDASATLYWDRRLPEGRYPPGDLAALRRGIGGSPGAVPAIWPFYTTLSDDGRVGTRLRAEHHALSLFGLHQQSQRSSMHQRGVRLGEALRTLRNSERYSEAALDRRVAQCATAVSVDEFAYHLRGLITMLRSLPQGLDYTRLLRAFEEWQRPHGADRVRRQIGADYFRVDKANPAGKLGKDTPS